MASTHIPKVSIGMPAFNSASTIGSAIESLLQQSFDDFELIVSDNASTDGTGKILQDYAARDPRVRVFHQPTNIGANLNYSAVVRLARGRYFKWASSSDWCAPDFLRLCAAVLDTRADVVLVYPRARLFQQDPANARDYEFDVDLQDSSPANRLARVVHDFRLNNAMNGLIRTDALRRTRLIEHYPSGDVVLMGHLALLGKLLLLPDALYYRRMEPETATSLMDAKAVERHHYPTATLRALFPNWKLHLGWLRVVLSVPMTWRERRRAIATVSRMCCWRWRDLIGDLAAAVRFFLPHPRRG